MDLHSHSSLKLQEDIAILDRADKECLQQLGLQACVELEIVVSAGSQQAIVTKFVRAWVQRKCPRANKTNSSVFVCVCVSVCLSLCACLCVS